MPINDVLGIVAPIRLHEVVLPAGLATKLGEGVLQGGLDPLVIPPLGDLPLHVRILVLDDARHQRVGRVHQVDQLLLGVADVFLHEFQLGKPDLFDGVGGEESILDVEEGRLRRLGDATRPEQKSPASWAFRAKIIPQPQSATRHHIVVAGVDIESPGWSKRPGSDVHDDRQPLARDRVQDLLHQHQALTGGEIGHASRRDRESLRRRWPPNARSPARKTSADRPRGSCAPFIAGR